MTLKPLNNVHFQHGTSYKSNGLDFYSNTTEVTMGIANSWTVACWVKTTQAQINARLWEIKAAASNANRLSILLSGTTGQLQFLNFTSGAAAIKNYVYNGVIVPNNWTHIVISWDGTNVVAYINGVLKAADTLTTNNSGTMTDTTRAVAFGAAVAGTNALTGTLHSMAVWNTVLTAAEASSLFNNGNGAVFDCRTVQPNNLQHWWLVERGDSSRGKDYGKAATPIDIATNATFTPNVIGTINDAPRQIIQTSPFPGHKYCIDFDGATEWMRNSTIANAAPNILPIANAWTIATWIKPTESSFASARSFLGFGVVGGSSRVQFQHEGNIANDPFNVALSDSGTLLFKSYRYNNMINANQAWQHIAVTWDGTSLVTYSNGAAVAADTTPTDNAGTMVKAARIIQFGAQVGASFWLGRMHSTAVWEGALTAGQVANLYNGGRGWDYDVRKANTDGSGLVHWWLFGDPNISIFGLAYDRIDSQTTLYGSILDPAAAQATAITVADDCVLDAPGL